MSAPLPRVPVALTAPELRALAYFHDTYAADVTFIADQAAASKMRAAELHNLADKIGPAEGDADAVL